MCGIVGYTGERQAASVLLEGLRRLEYRGYDSSGIAVLNGQGMVVEKAQGKLDVLISRLDGQTPKGQTGIGHTRWATHGRPSDYNAHPHTDCSGRLAVVHNGIIENYQRLRQELEARGHTFRSETDTEVVAHLLEELYAGDILESVQRVAQRMEGSYAMAVLSAAEPGRLVAIRKDSPLVIGLGEGENFLASDIPALLPYTRQTVILEDGETAVLTPEEAVIYGPNGRREDKKPFYVDWDSTAAEKGGYPHFMLKEIHEQPKALRDTLAGRTEGGQLLPAGLGFDPSMLKGVTRVAVVACGTAYHAGLVGKHLLERLARLPVETEVASEYRYRSPLIDRQTLAIVISQSGETADTLAALRLAKRKGARVLAITNVVGSSVAREADAVLYTWAGPEIAVASTKAYTTQLLALYLVAVLLGKERGTLPEKEADTLLKSLRDLPALAEETLKSAEQVRELAGELAKREDAFFIGRGLDHAVALEGALKLKEISYIHAESYAAGELKHGTLALIEEGVPVIALATQPALYDKMVSNIKEVKARGALVVAVTFPEAKEVIQAVDRVIYLPPVSPLVAPILAVIPLQLLAYYQAVARGCDVDQPRNLAKSVTVE